MRPAKPSRGTVGVLRTVREGMMDPMRRDPFDGAALKRKHATEGQDVLKPLGHLEAAMGEQAVEAQGNAQQPGDPLQSEKHPKGAPGERKRSQQRPKVDDGNADEDVPFNLRRRLHAGSRWVCHALRLLLTLQQLNRPIIGGFPLCVEHDL